MRVFISYSLSQTDQHIASLLSQQARSRGVTVDSTGHWVPWDAASTQIINQAIMAADVVIAIVSRDSQYTLNVQHELQTAMKLNKPSLVLVEKGDASLIQIPGLRYVEFDRHDPGPAIASINYTLESQKNQQNLTSWLVGGGLVLLALYLLSSEDKN
jgi:GTPase Era involved in 16S rRNA processing